MDSTNAIASVHSEQDAADLVNQIDHFISQNEAPQLNRLKQLASFSKQIYDFDKTVTTYSDNISLYQSFFKLKSDLAAISAQIRVDEQNRQQQNLLQKQLLDQQKQQQALQQQQDELRDQKLKLEQILRQQKQEQIEQKQRLEQEMREQREQQEKIQQLQQEQQKQLLEQQLREQRAQQEILEQEQQRLRDELERQHQQANHLQTIVEENKETKTKFQETFTEITYVPPSFVQQLHDATIKEGDRFTFQCKVTGNPEPNVEWFKDGLSLYNNPDYRQTITNGECTLTIEDPFAEDSARFTCKATNSVGASDTTALLTVQESGEIEMLTSPIFTKLLENSVAREGTAFEFRCFVTGNPLPTVQWFKNDVCIDHLKDFLITFNNGEAVLRFEEVFLEDQAMFTCKATNPYGTEQCSAALCVERKKYYFVCV